MGDNRPEKDVQLWEVSKVAAKHPEIIVQALFEVRYPLDAIQRLYYELGEIQSGKDFEFLKSKGLLDE